MIIVLDCFEIKQTMLYLTYVNCRLSDYATYIDMAVFRPSSTNCLFAFVFSTSKLECLKRYRAVIVKLSVAGERSIRVWQPKTWEPATATKNFSVVWRFVVAISARPAYADDQTYFCRTTNSFYATRYWSRSLRRCWISSSAPLSDLRSASRYSFTVNFSLSKSTSRSS